MLIGHLGTGMALKAWARGKGGKVPNLGVWFAAVLFADLVCFTLILFGFEEFKYDPYIPHFPYRLIHAPYSHSCLGAGALGVLAALVAAAMQVPARAAILLGVAIFSHFPLDLIVHGPDMAWAFEPPSLGFSLWSRPWISESLELLIFAGGVYLLLHENPKLWGRPFLIFLGGLLVAQGFPSLSPPIENPPVAAAAGLISMLVLVGWGCWGGERRGLRKLIPA